MKIENLVLNGYSIGVHGISGENVSETVKQILEKGIEIRGWGGILSTVQMHSTLERMSENEIRDIENYRYFVDSNGNWANVIVAVPETIKINDDIYFLGHYSYDSNFAQKGDSKSGAFLPFSKYTSMINMIPKEFIVGVIYGNYNDNKIEFIQNPDFFSNKSLEEQLKFIEGMKANGINVGTIEQLRNFRRTKLYQTLLNNGDEYFKQVEEYLSKEANQKV